MYYALAGTAALLFASQFLLHRQYQKQCGNTIVSALTFSLFTSCALFILTLCINGFRLEFSWFSLGLSVIGAVINMSFVYFSNRAFYTANLGTYSNFAMLGGMLLPALAGIVFFTEDFTVGKLASFMLIAASLLMTYSRKKSSGKAYLYYIAVFLLNGLFGVVSKIHQSFPALAVSSRGFLSLISISQVIMCISILLIMKKRPCVSGIKPILFTSGYAVLNGAGNLLVLIAMLHLPISVQSPLVTGGTLVFSAIISSIIGTKPTFRSVLSALLAFASTVAVIL